MPEITLREYESEIDKLIEEARYLEAFAHARHILKQHPRYVGAYYLVGKTLLEADLPELAVDMFRRTLSIDPEHMMARIGLGLAYQRLDHLNGAIWNLERAYELDPGSVDLTDELRRLYGRRDGTEPDHIPLNRASLARLYLRGNRTSRAVEELRNLLKSAPDRVDLKLALAEAYWRDAQLLPAVDMCEAILNSMRYCLKANLLLGALWINSGQDEGQVYLNRAQEIDLENTMADKLFGTESPLRTREVVLQRLVYNPSDISVDRQSEWFKRLENASVSVGVSEAPTLTEEEVRLVDISAGLESQIEIPDWLRELGGEEKEGEGEDEGESGLSWLSGFGTDQLMAREEAAAAEASSLKQAGAVRKSAEENTIAEEEEVPAWLRGVAQMQGTRPDTEQEEEAPDWLSEVTTGEEAPESTGEDWLTQLGSENTEEVEDATEEIPDWLTELKPTRTSPTGGISLPSEGVPEWLSTLQTSTEKEAETAEETTDWMQGLEVSSGEMAEETITEEPVEEVGEELPDWLTGFVPEGGATVPTEEVPDWLTSFKPETTEETAFDWVNVEPGEDAIADATTAEDIHAATFGEEVFDGTTIEESPISAEGEFDWESMGSAIDETQEAQETTGKETTLAEAGLPDTLSGDDALNWLSSLAAGKEDQLRAEAEAQQQARVDEILGRKTAPKAEPAAPVVPEVEEVPAATGEDFFGWQAFGEGIAEAGEATQPQGSETGEAVYDIFEEGLYEEGVSGETALGESIFEETAYEEEVPGLAAFGEDIFGEETSEEEALSEELFGEEATGESEFDWEMLGSSIDETPAAEEVATISAPADALSGDDALAWLSGLAAGKEDQLRADAEAQQQARVDEILGRKPTPKAEPVPAKPAPAAPVIPEVEEVPAASGEDFFGWQAFGEGIAEAGGAMQSQEVAAANEAAYGESIFEEEAYEEEVSGEVAFGEDIFGEETSEEEALSEELFGEEAAGESEFDWEMLGSSIDETPAAEEEVAPITAPADALSGDDALAWLSGLAAGKEDQLRAEAEEQQQARVDEILGRKPAPKAEPVPAKPAPAAPVIPEAEEVPAATGEDFFGWQAFGEGIAEAGGTLQPQEIEASAAAEVEETIAEEEAPAEEVAAPADMLSGDDALAWLSNLAAGKEDQLRAEAEAQQQARVDEILGRKPATKPLEPAPAKPEPVVAETPVEEVAAPADMLSGDDALAWLSTLAAGKEDQLRAEAETQQQARVDEILGRKPATKPEETAPAKSEPAATAPAKPAVEELPTAEATPAEMLSGDDALNWLSSLAAGKEDKLRAESEAEKQARVDELLGRTPTRPLPPTNVEEREEVAPPKPTREPAREPRREEPKAPEKPKPTATRRAVEEKTPPPAQPVEAAAAPATDSAIPGAKLSTTEFNALRAHVEKKRDDDEARLKLARALWAMGEVKESMAHYTRLTRTEINAQVIKDLEHYRQTQPSSAVLRTLGDAYMKEGALEAALAAYSQAMSAL